MTAKGSALLFQFSPNLVKVINLAVVGDPIARLRILHGLMTLRRKIENREPPITETDFKRLRACLADDYRA
jgi:hypothetical protein